MCLLMMKKTINAALIFFLLVDQMLHIFGNVIVLRKTLDHRRQVACLTENDGSALIWNDELISQMYQIVLSHKNKFNNKENINCKMNANEDCLNSWTKQYWNITYSFKTPMAPVFDERWEEFTEYSNKNVYDRIAFDSLPTSATALSFSVRASSDVYIFLCNSKNYRTDFCYWIVIGGWKNTLSVIRKCTRGVPVPGQYTVQNSKCAQNQVEFRHKPLSTTEWRSFVITWDSAIRNITVYDTDKMIMTYVDKEERKLSEILPHIDYQVFIRSNPSMLLRFHLYHFLHTTIEGATLTSPIFKLNDTTICIQMFIGLCPECDAHVFLRDSTSNEVLEMVTAKGSSKTAIYGLPTWQSVKIEKNLPTTKSVVIQLIPKLNMSSANPLWAIANVQQCPNEYWKRIFTSKVGSNNYVWPNMTCQKLFYDEHTIVSSASSVRNNIKDDDTNCNNHTSMIGPRCSISCENNFMFDYRASCRSVVICYKNGCTCPPGFIGSECTDTCGLNKYGHNCNKSCGSCAKEIDHEGNFCNKITGFCYGGCKNTKKLYIPPLCHTGIDTSVALVTNYTNQTSVQVTIPMTWKDEYEEATIFYSFIIQGQFNNYYVQKSWNRIFPNTTHLIGNFADLEIGTTYLIKYGLQIEKSTVYSDWHSVETDCIPILLFDITLGETNLTINWQINENVSLRQQSCPPNWYRLEVQHNNTVVHVVNESAMHFPYEVSSLKPYTLYNVIIFRKYLKLFSQEIRTHEGVPTPVLNFRAMSQSSEQVTTINHSDNITLMWQEPSLPNGEIVRYDVTVKVKTYIGCMDMELPSPNNHIIEISTKNTTITISNFHPYAYYSVSVTAFNSNYGSTAIETIFQTNESDIPTEIFSQLILQGQILSWTIPEDCTTITGPLKAKIKIYGISDLVKNFSFTDWTKSYFYDLKHIIPQLHGAERYVAKVYVIRDWKSSENASAFQKYEFETPPAAPPQITNLDVVEIDTRHTPATIYLRWQSPLPPFNGKLDYYVIRICDMYYRTPCQNFSVQVNKSCDLWNDYICGSVKNWSTNFQIQILTYNINVTQPSVPVNVTKAMLNNTIPDTPENYTFTINNNSIVDVRWNHPWKTGSHLQNFNIWLEEISSNLTMRVFQPSVFKMQKYTVTHYMRYYNKQLYLFPSTLYHIHIQAVTVTDKVSAVNTVIVQTPTAIDFDGNVNITMQEPNSTISISIPPVVNETRNSVMHILVKGCNFCEQYSEVPEILQAEINMDKNAWMQAAEGSISKFANSTFILGNKETCGRVTNCSLKSEGLYEIAIIITEENLIIKRIMFTTSIHNFSIEVPSQYHKAYVICPIITCLVLIAVTFYFYRRRKKQTAKQCTSQDGIVLSPNIRNCVSEDCVDETTSVISTSKQIRNKSEEESNTIPIEIYENTRILSANLSTASDRQPLSLATIPEMPLIAIENDDEKKETASLVEDKELNHYEIMR